MLARTQEPEKLVEELYSWIKAERGRGRRAARAMGISPQQLTNWLRGYRRPSLDGYFAIQRFLEALER
jgi:transcriptional regulator with XRE-family HTH domain